MVDYVKSRQAEGHDADDFAGLTFTTTATTRYFIGTNAYGSDDTLVTFLLNPPAAALGALVGFLAQEVLLYATEDCLVRFNGPSRITHIILAGNYYTFRRKVHTIYVVGSSATGALYVHATG